ncbi:MAG: hypothetical protein JSS49_06830 [Planctomycetes bacterium]|nr:hypothetical protein [Planctomycetota bacterium]
MSESAETDVVNDNDVNHLRLLSIFHYVVAALMGMFTCFPGIYVVMGTVFLTNPPQQPVQNPEELKMIGGFFLAFGLLFVVIQLALAIALFVAGKSISTRRRYTYCMIVAAISCLFFPFGTALGVCTLIVLSRASVKKLYELAN